MVTLFKHPEPSKYIKKDLRLIALATNNTHKPSKALEAAEWLGKLSQQIKANLR
jgi:hypothetical protein